MRKMQLYVNCQRLRCSDTMKKIFAFIMVAVSLFSVMSVSAYAEDLKEETITVTVNETVFTFDANTSEDFRNKVIADYFNEKDEDVATYGLMCTLFGHKLESSVITVITHKVKATAPRCLRERFDTEACTRCNYTHKELITSSYISCC